MVDFIKQHWQYFIGALLLHALFAAVFGLTMLNMQRTPPPVQLAIQAVIVDPSALNQSSRRQQQQRREREAQAQREREQAAEQQQRREQEQAAEQRRREQEEVQRKETEQRAEQARQVEVKQRQEAEQRRQAEEQQLRERQDAEKKRAAADAEKKRQADAEAKRVAEIERKQKEEAERRRAADDARLQSARESDLQRQLQEEEADAAAMSSPEMAQYQAMIRQAVQRRWNRPLSARDDLLCQVVVRQTPAGVVLSVRLGSCNGDAAVRQSVETAVFNASPLPTPSNPRLFRPEITFNFRPDA